MNGSNHPPQGKAYSDHDYYGYRLRRWNDSPKSMTERAIDWMVAHPGVEFGKDDLAAALEIDRKAASGVLSKLSASARRDGRLRLHWKAKGRYVYDPHREVARNPNPARPGPAPRETDALKPLTDEIPDDAFKAVGLIPVASTSDGDRICVDDAGTAWRVKVTVEAHLI